MVSPYQAVGVGHSTSVGQKLGVAVEKRGRAMVGVAACGVAANSTTCPVGNVLAGAPGGTSRLASAVKGPTWLGNPASKVRPVT